LQVGISFEILLTDGTFFCRKPEIDFVVTGA
jgi:hypothetical protein